VTKLSTQAHGATHQTRPPVRTIYSWLSAEDVIRCALAAYYSACRSDDQWHAENPDDPPSNLAFAFSFAESVSQRFELRLHDHGHKLGLPSFGPACGDVVKLQDAAHAHVPLSDPVHDTHRAQYYWSHVS
jgi:hypothetical protein